MAESTTTSAQVKRKRRRDSVGSRSFSGFPEITLLETGRIPLVDLARLACREGQSTNPLFRVHRWFARRLSSQFRGILTALTLPGTPGSRGNFWRRYFAGPPLHDVVVLDPFVGGGTSLAEASRCGARVIGYDIDPVATTITRFELGTAEYDGIPAIAAEIMARVRDVIAPLHETRLEDGRTATVLHHFWVEVIRCAACEVEIELHPHYRLAFDAKKGLQWVFCRACSTVYERPLDEEVLECSCGEHTPVEHAPLSNGTITCPACAHQAGLSAHRAQNSRPVWRLFAQEYIEGDPNAWRPPRRFKAATREDHERYKEAARMLAETERLHGPFAPHRALPTEGRSDMRPFTYGFSKYRDFFNGRQLLHLTLLGREIAAVENESERRLLGLAFSDHLTTNCMYTGYAFGYRRTSPLFSIHGFRHITRPVELNPWLYRIGRGTFPNALDKIRKAIEFAKAPSNLDPAGGKRKSRGIVGVRGTVESDPSTVLRGEARAAIVTSSSISLEAIADASVDLVLTDPPYFDNVSYSELSDFYLAWHQALGIAPAPYDDPGRAAPISENLAVTSRSHEAVQRYQEELTRVLSECRRVLRPCGICVFTYHHESASAWRVLAHALHDAGLRCTAVIPMRGEGNGGLHSYDGTIKWDAVLVCRHVSRPRSETTEDLTVILQDVDNARATVRAYEKLLAAEGVGFRTPDAHNLYRALLAAAAGPKGRHKDEIDLAAALAQKPAL